MNFNSLTILNLFFGTMNYFCFLTDHFGIEMNSKYNYLMIKKERKDI